VHRLVCSGLQEVRGARGEPDLHKLGLHLLKDLRSRKPKHERHD